ncbi:MAG: glycoside hydrolase family 38 C-terminal domain-containing protein, partial [Candidatus Acidiferrales bacterium]
MSHNLVRDVLRSVAILFCALVLFDTPAMKAQTPPAPDPTQAAIDSLSRSSQAVIQQLSTLSNLPVEEWRFHAGDFAHAESVDLDDSKWEVRKGENIAPPDSVWFRRWIEVPKNLNGYDLSGSKIWFQFQVDVNGPITTIVYVDGRRVAMGEDLEPIVLFENCQPGDKVLVAVKLLQTVDEKRIHPAVFRIFQPSSRPSPYDMREEFVSAALLIPSLATDPSAEKAILERAIGAVDLAALGAANQNAFDASLRKSEDVLQAIQPTLRKATYHLTGNSHIDAAWIWPWTETVDTVRHTWGTALQLMNEYPQYTFTQSAAQYNVWMAEKYPQLNEGIKQRIREGRWEIVGGMWIEPDLNMPDGESQVRQILIGKRTYQQLYGVDVRIGWNPDSFGYNWQLPQIYKRSGIDYFVTQKMVWNDTNQLPLKLFWWESPDGSKVLTYFPHNYDNADFNPSRLAADLFTARERSAGLPEMMDLYGVGDHGGGVTRDVLDDGLHWSAPDKILPKMQFGLAQTFFSDVETKLDSESPTWNYASLAAGKGKLGAPSGDRIKIPTWNDELYFEYHRGVQTTQANHKRSMRESEEWTLNAEKYASLAWLNGSAYPHAELNDAWKKVLFNQFHDLAAGSGIGVIYKDAQKDYDEVRRATNEVSAASLHTVQAEIDTRGDAGVPVVVFNPLAWNRSGIVSVEVEMPAAVPQDVYVLDAHQRVLPSLRLGQDARTNALRLLVQARDVPSFGYEVVRVVPGKRDAQTDLQASGLELENSFLRVKVNAQTGCISSLYDKKSQFETLASGGCGNELIAFKDIPKN